MTQTTDITQQLPLAWPSYIAGEPVQTDDTLEVRYPWDGSLTGTLPRITPGQLEQAIQAALGQAQPPTRSERYEILMRARELLAGRADEFANLIRLEAGLCMRETRYEVGRAQEVFKFAAAEALRDDESIFSCDAAKNGPARKIFTMREPLSLVAAITPFNHPLNQVAHKLAPAIAAGVPVLLKPSSKTPLVAIRLTELLYEAGLPPAMLSTFVGDRKTITEALVRDPRVDLVTFTGGTGPGKHLATIAGYKKLCLELGGNAPFLVFDDADVDAAIEGAAQDRADAGDQLARRPHVGAGRAREGHRLLSPHRPTGLGRLRRTGGTRATGRSAHRNRPPARHPGSRKNTTWLDAPRVQYRSGLVLRAAVEVRPHSTL